jgi:hypothetical protein
VDRPMFWAIRLRTSRFIPSSRSVGRHAMNAVE